ncbi:hypothetical protein D3C84_1033690 [compost metagenome]
MLASQTLGLLIGNQSFELRPGSFQQQGETFIESTLAILRRRDAVEAHQGMQAQPRQRFTPGRFAVVGAADEIQHRQQGFAATGQHFQLVAILGQYRFPGVDHVEPGVRRQ